MKQVFGAIVLIAIFGGGYIFGKQPSTQLALTKTVAETIGLLTPYCGGEADCIKAVNDYSPNCFEKHSDFRTKHFGIGVDPADVAMCINGESKQIYFSISKE